MFHSPLNQTNCSGEENYLFFKYLLWFRTNAHTIGGMENFPFFNAQSREIYRKPFRSDLEGMRRKHSVQYPTVSLFNLHRDPTESNNLASDHPGNFSSDKVKVNYQLKSIIHFSADLVEELLAEAERLVDKSPSEV